MAKPYLTPTHTAKYLGMTQDAKLHWKVHVKNKGEELGLKYKHIYCVHLKSTHHNSSLIGLNSYKD